MSQNSKKSIIGSLIALLFGLVVAKGLWSIVDFRLLPKKGIDLKEDLGLKPLYYHYNLASKKEVIKAIVHKQAPKKVIPKIRKKKIIPEKIESFLFKGLYNSNRKKFVVIEYKGKTAVLGIGEEFEGYKLISLKGTIATFAKNGKQYELDIYKKYEKKGLNSRSGSSSEPLPSNPIEQPIKKEQMQSPRSQASKLAPHKEGATTVIPKDLFDRYRTNLRQIQKNMNAVPYMVNGQLEGFKVNYIKKGSDFSKLGIKRGDIIIAVNGEPLNNLKVPIEFFKNLDTMTAATFTIKRGNEIKELEYEVR